MDFGTRLGGILLSRGVHSRYQLLAGLMAGLCGHLPD